MAFGAIKGTLVGGNNSIPNPLPVTGSVAAVVGDLVVVLIGQQTGNTSTAVADNLGNVYVAQNAGSTSTISGRLWYSRVTVAGTITTINITTTSSTNDVSACAAVIEGPFIVTPIDANPANVTADTTTPFTCPASGTLAQANEVIVGWIAGVASSPTYTGGGGFTKAIQQTQSANATTCIATQTVSATTTQTPSFTSTAAPTADVLGTCSFKKDPVVNKIINISQAQARTVVRQTGHRVPISQTQNVSGRALVHILSSQTAAGLVQLMTVARSLVARKVLSVSQSENVTGNAEAHIFSSLTGFGIGQLVSLTENLVTSGGAVTQKVINVTQGQLASLLRSMKKILNVIQSENVTGNAEAHIFSSLTGSGLGQLVSLTENFVAAGGATTQKVISVVQSQSALLTRSMRKLIVFSQSQLLFVQTSIRKLLNILQSSDVSGRTETHIRVAQLGTGLGETISLVANFVSGTTIVQKVISVVQGQSVSLVRSLRKIVSILQPQSVLLGSFVGKRLVVSQGENVFGNAEAHLRSTDTGTGLGQLITVTRNFVSGGASTTQKVISVTQGQLISLLRSIRRIVLISQSQLTSVTEITSAKNKILSIVQAQIVSLTRGARHAVAVSQGEDVSGRAEVHVSSSQTGTGLSQIVTVVRNFVAGGSGAVTQKVITLSNDLTAFTVAEAHIIVNFASFSMGQIVSVIRNTGAGSVFQKVVTLSNDLTAFVVAEAHIIVNFASFSMGQIVSLVTFLPGAATQKIISVTQHTVLDFTASVRIIVRSLTGQNVSGNAQAHIFSSLQGTPLHNVITVVTNFVAASTNSKLINVSMAQAVSLSRSVRRIISLVQVNTITVLRSVSRKILVSTSELVSLVASHASNKILNMTQGETVTLQRRKSGYGLIVSTIGQSVSVFKKISSRISVSLSQFVSLVKAVKTKIVLITQAQLVTIFSSPFASHFVTILVTTGQFVTLVRSIFQRVKRKITQGRGQGSKETRPSHGVDRRSRNNTEHG